MHTPLYTHPHTYRVTEEMDYLSLEGLLQLHELAVVATLYLIVEEGGQFTTGYPPCTLNPRVEQASSSYPPSPHTTEPALATHPVPDSGRGWSHTPGWSAAEQAPKT